MKNTRKLFIGLLAAAVAIPLAAAEQPYKKTGIINAVYLDAGRVVISDRSFPVVPYVQVNDSGSQFIGPQYLKPDAPVGFNTTTIGNTPHVIEVWILNELPQSTEE